MGHPVTTAALSAHERAHGCRAAWTSRVTEEDRRAGFDRIADSVAGIEPGGKEATMKQHTLWAISVGAITVVLLTIACTSSDDPSGAGAGGAAASAGSSGEAGSSAAAGVAGTEAADAADACTASIEVQAKSYPFTESGVTLATGQQLVATATGSWSVGGTYGSFDANGAEAVPAEPCALDPSSHMGTLLGSLDGGTTWFVVGSGPTTITGNGMLVFAANDCPGPNGKYYFDNKGAIVVSLAYECDL